MRSSLAMLAAAVLVGCDAEDRQETEVKAILRSGSFVRVATTTVGGDRLDFWHEPTDEDYFGPFLIIACDGSGRLIAFCRGKFTSSSRPFFQDDRYCVVVGHADFCREDAFFVYDSREKRFLVHEAPAHVHDGFVIVGDRILFSSCKTPEPVWLVDLKTGTAKSLGREAPQAAEFHVGGSAVLISGYGKVFELAGDSLVPSRQKPPAIPATGRFERIRVR